MKNIYIFRHGETDYNKYGHSKDAYDIDLNANGKEQAAKLCDIIKKNKQLDIIISSPLKRTLNTAKIATQNLNIKISTNDNLKEINYGDYFGLSDEELNCIYKNEYGENFVKNVWKNLDNKYDDFCFPNGETKKQARKRIFETIKEIGKLDYNNIGISCHGGIMKYLIFEITGKKFHIDNCEVIHIGYNTLDDKLIFIGNFKI